MDKQSRRQVVRDYKERKVSQGIFAVRCAATGEAWVGKSRNLEQQQNGIWFGLRSGGYVNRVLQAARAAALASRAVAAERSTAAWAALVVARALFSAAACAERAASAAAI